MTAPRACTFDLNLLTGSPVPAGTVVSFLGKAMRGQYGSIVVPDTVSVTADASGQGAINLLPGDWTIKVKGQTLLWSADFGLGETGSTIIGELIAQAAPPITPAVQVTAEAARDIAVASAVATAADRVQTGLDRVAAGAARDSTFFNAGRTATNIAAGRALVANGEQFAVVEGDYVQLYTRTSPTAETNVEGARYPTAALLVTPLVVHEQVGTVAAAVGKLWEESVRLTDAADDSAVNIAAVLGLAQMIGQIADQINGGRVTLEGGTLADPALGLGTARIYSAAANTLSVAIAGVERLRVTTSGITVFGTVTTV